FPDDTNGTLKIALRHESTNRIRLTVEDDGTGLPEGVDWQHRKGIGLRLIHILSNQIQGDYQFQTLDGTSFSLIFPERLSNE
ncbi:MAG: ATP-binding protein, partial [SAR324 cluster bacterium]|nr:ATP-binding protein [SAR324 cluster bacterium]